MALYSPRTSQTLSTPTTKSTSKFALLGISLLLAGCATNLGQQYTSMISGQQPAADSVPAANTQRPVKIALLLPLAGLGQTAAIAKSLKQAAEMALFERNDPNVELIVKDAGGSSNGAQAAATLAIAEGANLIVGPLLSQSVPGAALAARQANLPVLALSNDVRVAGNGVYLMSFLVEEEVDRVVGYAVARGKRQMAALVPDNAYGSVVESAFRNAARQHGAAVRIIERYKVQANGMMKPTKRIMDAVKRAETAGLPIDSLFVPGGPETLPSAGPILTYAGIGGHNIQMLGTGNWDYPNVGRETAFLGGWYAGPDPAEWNRFSERFTKTFGHVPPRIASLAYDAVGYAISLARESNGPNAYSPSNIARLNGYKGVDGFVRLAPDGRPQRALAILEVQQFGASVIDPAPPRPGPQTVSSVYQ